MAKKQSTQDQLVNIQAANLAAQVAQMAAQLEFQKERFRLLELPEFKHRSQIDIDRMAFDKAQAEYQNAFQEATLTGTYRGQPTLQYLTQVAQMTGVLNGQQTLQGKLTDAQVSQINATIMNTQRGMDLEYAKFGFSREQWSAEHQMALEKQQADLTGYVNGLPTFQREQWQANQAQSYLNLLGSLRGPDNAFAFMRVLRNTPEALKQMAQSWAGQFSAPTGGASGQPLRPVTPTNMLQDPFADQPVSPTPGLNGQPNPPVNAQEPYDPNKVYESPATRPPASGYNPAQGQEPYDPNKVYESPATRPPASGYNPAQNLQIQPLNITGKTYDPSSGRGTVPPVIQQSSESGGDVTYGATRPPDSSYNINQNSGSVQPTIPAYSVNPPGDQAPVHAYNYGRTLTGGTTVYPPGIPAPANQPQVSTYQPVTVNTQKQMLADASPDAFGMSMPDPGQINAREYNKASDYEKRFGWAGYEAAGWDKGAAQERFQRSLPKYGVSDRARGMVRI